MVEKEKSNLNIIRKKLLANSSKSKAKVLQGFFKTGPGEYAQGDIFWGVTVPKTREIAKQYMALIKSDILELLKSEIHEQRLLALLILVEQFKKADQKQKKQIFKLYTNNTKHINNWDLVDLTAPKIVGTYLYREKRDILYKFAQSDNLWQKRISIVATYYFIKQNDFIDTFKIAKFLLNDNHDLIHKAVGWMIREVGKKDISGEEVFLKKHYKKMPRTMLRYAIEKFPKNKRVKYLKSLI